MIIVRTPLRVSLFGGGTDFKEFYSRELGEVISFTIDKSIYVTVNKKFDGKVHLRYSKTEVCSDAQELKHDLVRECLKYVGITSGIEIVTVSDVPAIGTGLGSSSCLTVGLLKALFAYVKKDISNAEIAEIACEIEIDRLGAKIGKQDQYACALGGLNYLLFNKDGRVEKKLLCEGCIGSILDNLFLFYIPTGRKSSSILKIHNRNIKDNMKILELHKAFVNIFLTKYAIAELTLEGIGDLLNKSWEIKKKTSPATNDVVEQAMLLVKEHGGLGAKVCGAGGGGFLLAVSNKEEQLTTVMEQNGFRRLDFKYFPRGSEIIYRSEL